MKITIVAPTGTSLNVKDVKSPDNTQKTEIITEVIITVAKRLQSRIDVSAGKIIIAEISKVPSIRIPTTIVMAVSREIIVL